MNTFLYGWLIAFFVLLHLRVVGNVQYKTSFTNNDYRRTIKIKNVVGLGYIKILCREIKHSVKHDTWLYSNNYYTYEVTIEQLTESGVIFDSSTATYPRYGGGIFRRSKYPHSRAVNAHLDAISLKGTINSSA